MKIIVASYALVLLAIAAPMKAIEPVDIQPIKVLSETLNKHGQVRIAHGVQDVFTKDKKSGEIYNAPTPLLITTNAGRSIWTLSVLHNKLVGSTLLIGENLRHKPEQKSLILKTFNRDKAQSIMPRLSGFDPTFYPDEIERVRQKYGYQRIFTGRVRTTTHPTFKTAFEPQFMDFLVDPKTGYFKVFVVDQYGTCGQLAFGGQFSEKN